MVIYHPKNNTEDKTQTQGKKVQQRPQETEQDP